MGETRRVLPEWARFALSLVFLFVVAVATAGLGTPFFLAIMLSAAVAIAVLQLLFPVGRLFPIAFANLITVYAAIFSRSSTRCSRATPTSCPSLSRSPSSPSWPDAGSAASKCAPWSPIPPSEASGACSAPFSGCSPPSSSAEACCCCRMWRNRSPTRA